MVPSRSGNRSEATKVVKISLPKRERFRKCLAYTLPFVWNNLPVYLRKFNSIANFKKYMKIYICTTAFARIDSYNVSYFCTRSDANGFRNCYSDKR